MKNKEDWIIGMFVGDGSISEAVNNDYKISFYVESFKFAQIVCEEISETYGVDPKIYAYKKKRCYEVYFRNKQLWKKFLYLKRDFESVKKRIHSPLNFIAGIIDSEGCIDLKGYRITITLKNPEASKFVFDVLTFLDFNPSIYKTKNDKVFRIRIYGKSSMLKILPYLRNPEKIEKLSQMVPRQQTGPTVRGESQGSEPD